VDEILGNEEAIAQLKQYATDIDNRVRRKPILISGPCGTGKSASARLIAEQHGWNIVELNASDYRDKESIDTLLVAASQARTIFGKTNLILLDEIDELAPRFDKGANTAIANLLKNAKSPIIFIANNRWERNISFLRNSVDNIDFKKLTSLTIARILERFVKKNKLNVEKEIIDAIATRSNGDARSALNDIAVLDNAGKDSSEIIGMRDRKADIFTTLDKIFLSNTYSAPIAAAANSDVENDMLIKWIDESLPKRYANREDLAEGYNMLSMASIFASRASRSQYYTYWRYMNAYMTSGIALSKKSYPDRTKRYTFPKTIMDLSQSKERRSTRVEIARKLRKRLHLNLARIIKLEMPIMATMAKEAIDLKKEEAYDFFMTKFGLEQKEVDWLVDNLQS